MMTDLDESIGRLFDAYKRLGLNENTYFIVTSDNGGMPVLPQRVNRGRPYKNGLNAPLLRGKWDLMEGGIRVPFLAVGPDIKPNSQSNEPIIGYDLMATFAELAGSSQHVPEDSDGVSIVPLLGSPDAHLKRPPHGLVFHFPHYNQVGLNEPHSAIRVGNFKLVRFDQSMRSLLFNVATDLGEAHDMAESNAACVDKLEALLDTYLTAVGAEQPKDSSSWVKPGKKGKTQTRFLERYPVNVSTSYEGECLTDALI
jgi:arylsulfatase A-like enzyme